MTHATGSEWTFLVISVIVLVLSIWSERAASMDMVALLALRKNGLLKATAQANIRECYFAIMGAVVMVLAAALAIILPPPPPDYTSLPQTYVFLLAYIMLGFITALNALITKSARRKLMRMSPEVHETTAYITESPNAAETHLGDPTVLKGRRTTDNEPKL
jgi:hypothetical protein